MRQAEFPKLALGTWTMGGLAQADPNNDDDRDIAIIRTALDNGVRLVDTAQSYADGKAEQLVGQAIKGYDRAEVQILTKQKKANLAFDEVIEGCHGSLRRLGIDYLDYFLIHAPRRDVDLSQFFKATNQLYKEGLIRNVGVSNFGPKALQVALDTSELPIAVNQVSFSVNDSAILSSGTYDFCIQNGIPIQAYRALVDLASQPAIFARLKAIANIRQLTPQQVALAYINSYPGVTFTIRSSSAAHWQQIKQALTIQLDQTDISQLKRLHQQQKGGFWAFLDM
jgi:diketogulonate reductase-like aldo/keto reductase